MAEVSRDSLSRALDGDTEAIADLRRDGPSGLAAVLRARSQRDPEAHDTRWAALVDRVAGQRDASYSELYWYTDLASARAAAREKPILSLRLMGKLTDEFSCANSRFFRTALYSDPELASWLREHFVLHWSSERPVPKVTVDFGDGRVLQRTVTGNSAHYVLDADGRPIDAIPGLYGPEAFRTALEESLRLYTNLRRRPARRDETLQRHHARRIDSAVTSVYRSLKRVGVSRGRLRDSMVAAHWVDPTAAAAAPVALTKAVVERRLVEHIGGKKVVMTYDGWAVLAATIHDQVELHPRSVQLITAERPDLGDVASLVDRLEGSIARDTARNEYGLRVRIHDWFARGVAPDSLQELNARVYAELFLTPASDAWLGLLDPDVYTGLDHNGVTTQAAAPGRPQG